MMTYLEAKDVSLIYRVAVPRFYVGLRDGQRARNERMRSGGVEALHNVSFRLEAGDRLGLVGHNGAGKTTLLKVLYGIYEPTGGEVVRNGRVDALFNINLGFRRNATGRRNIVLRGLINGWSPARIEARIDEIIAFSELGDFIDMPFGTYSQGMAARLAFSVATTLDPEILLMDEWIGAGDASFQKKASARIENLTKTAGIVVLASHNEKLIRRVCNKVLILSHGEVADYLPIAEWRPDDQPATGVGGRSAAG